jgi:hypothetical protein
VALALAVGAASSWAPVAAAVGVDGPADADRLFVLSVGGGLDNLGGYGTDSYGVLELAGRAEWRPLPRLALSGAASLRGDVAGFDHVTQEGRLARSGAIVAQALVGYDGPRLHVGVGAWLYGEGREVRGLRVALLPGALRIRAGRLDGPHVTIRLADGAPFTTAGGGVALRALFGMPLAALPGHRPAAGLYATPLEGTWGLALEDDRARAGGGAWRFGALLGADLFEGLRRPELMVSVGRVWW